MGWSGATTLPLKRRPVHVITMRLEVSRVGGERAARMLSSLEWLPAFATECRAAKTLFNLELRTTDETCPDGILVKLAVSKDKVRETVRPKTEYGQSERCCAD